MSSLLQTPYRGNWRGRIAVACFASMFTAVIMSVAQSWPTVWASWQQGKEASVRSPDSDGDGLSDAAEARYGTDSHEVDTDHDGYHDGEEVAHGYDPLQKGGKTRAPEVSDADQDGLSDGYEARLGLDPHNTDTDKDGHPDGNELHRGFDPSGEGVIAVRILIPSIGVDAPLVWAQSEAEKDLQRDLRNGVIHYPGTAAPGQEGNSFITGHSSDYFWQDGNYKDVFKNVPNLKEGDEVIFYYMLANGRRQEFSYVLYEKLIVFPDDQRLFDPSSAPMITLVTCFPVGSNARRIAWRGMLQ